MDQTDAAAACRTGAGKTDSLSLAVVTTGAFEDDPLSLVDRVGWMLDERLPEAVDDRVHQCIPPKCLVLVIASNRS